MAQERTELDVRPGRLPHIYWIDLKNNGVLIECAVVKTDANGNRFYFEVGPLDGIDKQRLTRILTSRNARNFELWDLMSNVTLNNGVNALSYFHQLVKIISAQGVIYNPRAGVVGVGQVDTRTQADRDSQAQNASLAAIKAADAAKELSDAASNAAAAPRRGAKKD